MAYTPATVLVQYQSTALRGNTVTPLTPAWPAKDPSEVVTLQADFSLFGVPGTDVIAAAPVITAQDSAIKILSYGKSGLVVTLMLGGGTPGQTQPVSISVRLSNGQIVTRSVLLPVIAQQAAPSAAPFPLPSAGQTVVTDANTGLAVVDPNTGKFVTTS